MPEVQDVMWQPVEKRSFKSFAFTVADCIRFISFDHCILVAFYKWIAVSVMDYFITRRLDYYKLSDFILQEKSFRSLAYCIREHDILYRRGWIIQKIMACPFNRIQHCTVDSGPIDRKYCLSSLTLYTAGAEGANITIPDWMNQWHNDYGNSLWIKSNPMSNPVTDWSVPKLEWFCITDNRFQIYNWSIKRCLAFTDCYLFYRER